MYLELKYLKTSNDTRKSPNSSSDVQVLLKYNSGPNWQQQKTQLRMPPPREVGTNKTKKQFFIWM